jgi:hypothetical protein
LSKKSGSIGLNLSRAGPAFSLSTCFSPKMAQRCLLSATGETHEIPAWTRVKQKFDDSKLDDVPKAVEATLSNSGLKLEKGWSVALTVGSRGIDNVGAITRAVSDWCRAQGAHPFVVPSMGTHGGATAEGQREMIEALGCTEEVMGCPIKSGMETIELPRGDLPCPVLHDKLASQADACIAINRIKPHTQVGTAAFLEQQPFQSGIYKMIVIGLGNNDQAQELHAGNYPRRMCELMPAVARQKIALSTDGSGRCNIVAGIAIVENAYDQTMLVEAMTAKAIEQREPQLLKLACEHMPRLCTDKLDVLLLDETGKNISGTVVCRHVRCCSVMPIWFCSVMVHIWYCSVMVHIWCSMWCTTHLFSHGVQVLAWTPTLLGGCLTLSGMASVSPPLP